MLITEDEKNHYVLIKDFNRLMFNHTKYEHKKHFCMYCLQCFTSERVLNKHKENCMEINGVQAIKMPTNKDKILKFNNFHKQLPVPFVIYADFEAITEKNLWLPAKRRKIIHRSLSETHRLWIWI